MLLNWLISKIMVIFYLFLTTEAFRFILSHTSSVHGNGDEATLNKFLEQKFQRKMDHMTKLMEKIESNANRKNLDGKIETKSGKNRLPNGLDEDVIITKFDSMKGDDKNLSEIRSKITDLILDSDVKDVFDMKKRVKSSILN